MAAEAAEILLAPGADIARPDAATAASDASIATVLRLRGGRPRRALRRCHLISQNPVALDHPVPRTALFPTPLLAAHYCRIALSSIKGMCRSGLLPRPRKGRARQARQRVASDPTAARGRMHDHGTPIAMPVPGRHAHLKRHWARNLLIRPNTMCHSGEYAWPNGEVRNIAVPAGVTSYVTGGDGNRPGGAPETLAGESWPGTAPGGICSLAG